MHAGGAPQKQLATPGIELPAMNERGANHWVNLMAVIWMNTFFLMNFTRFGRSALREPALQNSAFVAAGFLKRPGPSLLRPKGRGAQTNRALLGATPLSAHAVRRGARATRRGARRGQTGPKRAQNLQRPLAPGCCALGAGLETACLGLALSHAPGRPCSL